MLLLVLATPALLASGTFAVRMKWPNGFVPSEASDIAKLFCGHEAGPDNDNPILHRIDDAEQRIISWSCPIFGLDADTLITVQLKENGWQIAD